MRNIAYKLPDSSHARQGVQQATSEGREATVRILAAFANPLRLKLLELMLAEDSCVSDFVEALGCEQPKVSQHLAVLRDAGLLACRVEGRRRCYSLRDPQRVRALLGG